MTSSHRLEDLLTCAMQLRNEDPKIHRHDLIEIEFAIAEITGGEPNSHTACVEKWVHERLAGSAA